MEETGASRPHPTRPGRWAESNDRGSASPVLVLIVTGFVVGGLASSSWTGALLGGLLVIGCVVVVGALALIANMGGE